MELPPHEGGINELTFELSKENSQTFFLQNTKNMQKLSGRVPGTIYGKDLSHIFIYDKSTVKICEFPFDNSKVNSLIPPSWGGNSILAKNCCSDTIRNTTFVTHFALNNRRLAFSTKAIN
jgi:hypothetical protein